MRVRLTLITVSLVLLGSPLADAQTAADADYDPAEMEAARDALKTGTGQTVNSLVIADRLEFVTNAGVNLLLWDVQGWLGTDINKFWVKTNGEYLFADGGFDSAELQALYSRAISPYFDVQFGLRHDVEPSPSRTHAVIGLQGLAPYWFQIDAAAFISSKGEVTARIEAEYELLLTQRLILQPRTELNFSFQEMDDLSIGSGLSTLELGLRLRYEVRREFGPYIGISWNRSIGDTADFTKAQGEKASSASFVAGLRMWF